MKNTDPTSNPAAQPMPPGYGYYGVYQAATADDESLGLALNSYVKLISRSARDHALWLALLWAVTTAIVLVVVISRSPVYLSAAAVRIYRTPGKTFQFEDSQNQNIASAEDVNTQLNILNSGAIIQMVDERLKGDLRKAFLDPYFEVGATAAGDAPTVPQLLFKYRKATPRRMTLIFDISYQHPNPTVAASVANLFAEAYLDYNEQRTVEASVRGVENLTLQAQSTKAKIKEGELKIAEFKARYDTTSFERTQDLKMQQLSALSQEVTKSSQELFRFQGVREQIEAARKSGQDLWRISAIASNPTVQSALNRVAELEVQLSALSQRYLRRHPKVQELEESLDKARRQLVDSANRAADGLLSDIERMAQEHHRLVEEEAHKRQEYIKLDLVRPEYDALVRDLEINKQHYDYYFNRQQQLSVTWIQCSRAILHWQSGEFTFWRFDNPALIHPVWLGGGLIIARPDGWYRAAPGGLWDRLNQDDEKFRERYPGVALPMPGGPAYLFLQDAGGEYIGLASFDGHRLQLRPHPLDNFFRRAHPTAALRLADGRFLVATSLGGVAVLAADLQPVSLLDDRSGLESNVINTLVADAGGVVWLGTDWGISRLDMHPAYSWFDANCGLPRDGAATLGRLEGSLVVGGSNGIYSLERDGFRLPQFVRWPSLEDRVAQLVPTPDGWLAAGRNGLWAIHPHAAQHLSGPGEVLELVASRRFPGRVYARMPQGVGIWRHDIVGWAWEGYLPEPRGDLGSMAEDENGTLWIGASGHSVWQLRFPATLTPEPTDIVVRRMSHDSGLPAGFGRTQVVVDQGRALFITGRGLYRYDAGKDRFEPEERYGPQLSGGAGAIRGFSPDSQGGGWFLVQGTQDDSGLAPLELGRAQGEKWETIAVPDISRLDGVVRLHAETDEGRELLWLLGQSCLLRIDLTTLRQTPPHSPGRTRLLRVSTAEGRPLGMAGTVQLQAGETSLHFDYTNAGLEGERTLLYESRLIGAGKGRPELDRRSSRTFTDLRPGNYSFRVRARTADGRWSQPAVLDIVVPAPWWGTTWARTAAGLFLTAGIAGLIFLRTRHLTRERSRLEQIVTSRTAELARSNARLLQLNRIEHDEKLAARLVGERAQLELLRYQLNPHFLYNALNSIRALTFSQPEQAGEMVTHLSQFCRRTLSRGTEGLVPLSEEIGMLQDYLEIEKSRWQESLITELCIAPEATTELLPQFLLLPLVENAIKYGGRTSPGMLQVRVRISCEHGILLAEVSNTGRWVDPASEMPSDSTGIGLDNLRQRLATYYGPGATLEHRVRDGWVSVRLRLPRAMLRGSSPPHPVSSYESAHPTPATDR